MTNDVRFPLEDAQADARLALHYMQEGDYDSAEKHIGHVVEMLGFLHRALEQQPSDAGPYQAPSAADSLAHSMGRTARWPFAKAC